MTASVRAIAAVMTISASLVLVGCAIAPEHEVYQSERRDSTRSSEPEPTPTTEVVEEPAQTDFTEITWVMENSEGYSYDLTLALAPAAPADSSAHPFNSSIVGGHECGIDPTTDAVIPAQLRAVARTAGFETPLSFVIGVVGGSPGDDRIALEGTTECTPSSSGGNSSDAFRGNWSGGGTLYASGDGPPDYAFFILVRDYYSPAHPEGDADWLSGLSAVAYTTSSQYGTPQPFSAVQSSLGAAGAGLPLR